MTTSPRTRKQLRRDLVVAASCGVFVALMVGAAYAAVPFYNWFCRTTGFGGTTQVASAAPGHVLGRTMNVRFDANVASGLPWRFEPEQNEISLRIGEVATVNYKVTNETAREIVATASYNVTPPTVGAYFTKINCFCFTEQRLKPGETRDMTVVFYVDPSIARDHEQDDLNTITLSYTFYRVREPSRPVAEGSTNNQSKL
ncbi:MAG TPA: cytochrome c oxidase assembly protein [Pseudolabrys sp.]|nr:cytochrome c oxidase assembly protein [Pseudolabrys sp.]